MKKPLAMLNAAFAASLILAPAVIFAAPADGNRGEVKVDSSDKGDRGELKNDDFTASCDSVYVHGFNVIDSDGTFSVLKGHKGAEGASEQSGAWHAAKSESGNGFDFTVGPLHLDRGDHEVQVWDSRGVSDSEHSKNIHVDCADNGKAGSSAGTGAGNGGATSCPTGATVDQKQADSDRQKGDEDKKAAGADRQKGDDEARKSKEDADKSRADRESADRERAGGDTRKADADQKRADDEEKISKSEHDASDADHRKADAEDKVGGAEHDKAKHEKDKADAEKDQESRGGCGKPCVTAGTPASDQDKADHDKEVAADKARADDEQKIAEGEREKSDAEKGSGDAEKSRADQDAARADSDKVRADAEARQSKDDAAKAKSDRDLSDKERSAGDTKKADADRARSDSEQQVADTEKRQSDDDRSRADQEKRDADQERADSDKQHGDGSDDSRKAGEDKGKSDKDRAEADKEGSEPATGHGTGCVPGGTPGGNPGGNPGGTPGGNPGGNPGGTPAGSPGGTPPPATCPAGNDAVKTWSVVAGGRHTDRLGGNVTSGDSVMVNFTLADGCKDVALALVSYEAPSATFSRASADKQVLFQEQHGNFSGSGTLAVTVPGCFYQVDFVRGLALTHLGPANSNNFYSDQGRLLDADNGGSVVCHQVTPPAANLGVHKTVDPSGPVTVGTALAYDVRVTNSGTATGSGVVVDRIDTTNMVSSPSLSPFQVTPLSCTDGPIVVNSVGNYTWKVKNVPAGGHCDLTVNVTPNSPGIITNSAAVGGGSPAGNPANCIEPTCSTQTTSVSPAAVGTLSAEIKDSATHAVVTGGTILVDNVSHTDRLAPTHLLPGSYCTGAHMPAGYSLVGVAVNGAPANSSTPCVNVAANRPTDVVFTATKAPQTACVDVSYVLSGSTPAIQVPGGQVSVAGQPAAAAPSLFCNLPAGNTEATAVTPPSGFTVVGAVTHPEHLVPGTNPPVTFTVQPTSQPGENCGRILGTIVIAGTNQVVSGSTGSISEGGQTLHDNPALFSCQAPGPVTVSATAPSGYVFTTPSTTTATIVAEQVTPVVFQVQPASTGGGLGQGNPDGGNQGAGAGQGNPAGGTQPASGVLAASAQHAPTSGVLGTSIGMPLTGSEATGRIALSVVCVALGMFAIVRSRRSSSRL